MTYAVGLAILTGLSSLAAPVPQTGAFPFGLGEKHSFEVRFGPVKVGTSTMEIQAIDNIRGRQAFRSVFRVRGGTFFYKVDDVLQSWMDTQTLSSLRFHQQLEEGSRDREKNYEIYPERSVYVETSKPGSGEQQSVSRPLDDGSFLYFIRAQNLQVGETYSFSRYFRPDRNPIRIRVVRRERVTVPAGTFDAIVVRPTIKTKGIFAENGQAEVWFSADSRRIVLQLKSKLSFGTLNLFLTSYTPPK